MCEAHHTEGLWGTRGLQGITFFFCCCIFGSCWCFLFSWEARGQCFKPGGFKSLRVSLKCKKKVSCYFLFSLSSWIVTWGVKAAKSGRMCCWWLLPSSGHVVAWLSFLIFIVQNDAYKEIIILYKVLFFYFKQHMSILQSFVETWQVVFVLFPASVCGGLKLIWFKLKNGPLNK